MGQPIGQGGRVGGDRPGPVVLGIDARRPCDAATRLAFAAARRRGVVLHAVHAWRPPASALRALPFGVPEEDRGAWEDQEEQLLADALRPWRTVYPDVAVYPDVRLQSPQVALVHASETAGLVVVGCSGTSPGEAFRHLLRHARCPVTVVPEPAPPGPGDRDRAGTRPRPGVTGRAT
ncbi:universal stress protein [Streptomyces sp. NPDC048566]|uniref:universal stress protein n=1 Tax=Streptomyces sp. NPDC048566 TaxID=3365569 RepID=UPI003721FF21